VTRLLRRSIERPERVRVVAEPCACDGDRTCLYHYAQLGDFQQSQARRRAGITFGHGNGR
jgi:hypothetical protein